MFLPDPGSGFKKGACPPGRGGKTFEKHTEGRITMRSIRYFGNGDVHLAEVPEPQLVSPDDVKIRIAYCGVCGSDLHTKRAELDQLYGDSVKDGLAMGHEATGTVVELGPAATAKGLKVGDRVVYYFNTHCGSCYHCRNGQEQFCTSMRVNMSAMSDYLVVPEQSVYKLNDTCSLPRGSLIEPISVCLHGIDLCRIKPGMTVAISGGGAMGLILTQLALRSGAAKLTVFEPIASKREMALKLGARYAIDPLAEDRVAAGQRITNGIGYDVVIEASGNWRACDGIQKLVARGGLLEFFAALYKHDYDYPMNLLDAFFQEITIVGGVMQSPYMFPRSVALADELDLDALLVDGCVFTPEQVEDAFEAQMNGKTIKSLICFNPDAK